MTRTCPGRSGLRFTSAMLRFVLWKTCFDQAPSPLPPPLPSLWDAVGGKGGGKESLEVRYLGFVWAGRGLPWGKGDGWRGGWGEDANLGSHCERAKMNWRHDQFFNYGEIIM